MVGSVVWAQLVPNEMRGRISSTASALTVCGNVVGYVAAGFLTDTLGAGPTLAALSLLAAIAATGVVLTSNRAWTEWGPPVARPGFSTRLL